MKNKQLFPYVLWHQQKQQSTSKHKQKLKQQKKAFAVCTVLFASG
jgi:hypothetical protein